MNSGKLYIVATPIGNLQDITLRALDILKEVDIICCEDTRRTLILLNHYEIKNRHLLSFFSYNQLKRIDTIIKELKSGKNIAIVSDSGTPCISDPGSLLVNRVIEEGITVESIPGPASFVVALTGSGLPTNGFVFLGFLPRRKSKIKKILLNSISLKKTIIFYESPLRLLKTLIFCSEIFNSQHIKCAVARELTKKFEEYIRGTIDSVYNELVKRKDIKGEIIVLLFPANQT